MKMKLTKPSLPRLDLRRPPLVHFRRLGQTQAHGLAYVSPTDPVGHQWSIHIDQGLKGRAFLEVLIHECIHLVFPGMEEEHVRKLGRYLALCLWAWGVRIDEHDIKSLVEERQ